MGLVEGDAQGLAVFPQLPGLLKPVRRIIGMVILQHCR